MNDTSGSFLMIHHDDTSGMLRLEIKNTFYCSLDSPNILAYMRGIREIFLSFQGGFSKMYRIYRKILNSDEGDFEISVKSGMFLKKFWGSFQGASLKIRKGMYVLVWYAFP